MHGAWDAVATKKVCCKKNLALKSAQENILKKNKSNGSLQND